MYFVLFYVLFANSCLAYMRLFKYVGHSGYRSQKIKFVFELLKTHIWLCIVFFWESVHAYLNHT